MKWASCLVVVISLWLSAIIGFTLHTARIETHRDLFYFVLLLLFIFSPGPFIVYYYSYCYYPSPNGVWVSFERLCKYGLVGMAVVIPAALAEYSLQTLYDDFFKSYGGEDSKMSPVFWMIINCLYFSFVVASFCEETAKLVISLAITPQNNNNNKKDLLFACESGEESSSYSSYHPYTIVLLSLAGSIGLASLENSIYIASSLKTSPHISSALVTACIRAFTTIPLHAATGAMIASYVARRRFHLFTAVDPCDSITLLGSRCIGSSGNSFSSAKRNSLKMLSLIFLPPFLHGFYDFCAFLLSDLSSLYSDSPWPPFLLIGMGGTVVLSIELAERSVKSLLKSLACEGFHHCNSNNTNNHNNNNASPSSAEEGCNCNTKKTRIWDGENLVLTAP